jgi:hypothetical protein
MECLKCPQQETCHDHSIGDLQMIRAIDGFFKVRDMVKLEKSINLFWRRLRTRHETISGR